MQVIVISPTSECASGKMKKQRSKVDLYQEALIESGYDPDLVAEKFEKLSPRNLDVALDRVKASILFLSGRLEELDELILEANEDHHKVMNWAQVKADRT